MIRLTVKDCKDERNFKKISDLYKASFPKHELINTKNFHKYAFSQNIFFKTFYDGDKFIGFAKGFIEEEILYISFLAIVKNGNSDYESAILSEIKRLNKGSNIILILRNAEKLGYYKKMGFYPAEVCSLKVGDYVFVCSNKKGFDEKKVIKGIKKNDWPLMFVSPFSTYVYYANVQDLDYKSKYPILNEERIEKAQRYAFDKDKKLSVGAWLLLKKALKMRHVNVEDYKLCLTEKGKPYLEGCPFNFSISHSKDYVAVALSKKGVGIDIQEIKPYNEKILNTICNEKDFEFYKTSDNKSEAFYKIWTFKESLLKKTGEGLSGDVKSVRINYAFEFNGTFLYSFDIKDGYILSVASEVYNVKPIKEITL